ncbi:hypothetical protein [Bradyrhizobium sp. USDA 10063]
MPHETAALLLGSVTVLIGVILAIGGGWFVDLEGSPYYLPTGFGLIASGYLVAKRPESAWGYVIVLLIALLWAWWEFRLNGWIFVPRTAGPIVLLIWIVAVTPWLHNRWPRLADGLAGIVAVIAGLLIIAGSLVVLMGPPAHTAIDMAFGIALPVSLPEA